MSSPVDEIKQKIDIVDLLGEYIKLTPAGSNFKAKCPFHNEKTASFMVSPEKQIWHCFGCSKGGDIFSFVKEMEGIEFPEALRILAKRAGVKLTYQNPEHHNQKTKLLDICRTITDYWHNNLLTGVSAQFVRDYIKTRNLTDETVKDFSLGYAADSWDDAIKYLQSQNFSLKEIIDAGIAVAGERGKVFDRFKNRLMFPIRDIHGNVVGFTSRKMSEDDKGGKYINTPQTLIYNKSQILYNLDLAKQEIKRLGYAILVEGNMDAIASYQAGIKNVVAVSGTALTVDQIQILKRYTQNVMIAFDADVAGTNANLRGIDLAWQAGFNIKVIHLPDGQDPDDLIQTDAAKWKSLIKEANNFMDYVFEVTFRDLDISRVDHKKLAAKKILALIAKFGDEVEKSHYLKKLAEKLGVSEEALKQSLPQAKKDPSEKKAEVKAQTQTIVNKDKSMADHLLALIINFPTQVDKIIQNLEPEAIRYQPGAELYRQLIIYYNNNQSLDEEGLKSHLKAEDIDYLNQISLLVDKEVFADKPESISYEVKEVIKRIKEAYFKDLLAKNSQAIALAEKNGNQQEVERLLEESLKITNQINNF